MATRQNKSIAGRIRAAFKGLVWGENWQSSWDLGAYSMYSSSYGTSIDYRHEAGDLSENAIVMAAIAWLMRTEPEARVKVMRRKGEGDAQEVQDHPLMRLLKRPNPYMSLTTLRQFTIYEYKAHGTTYWRKVRNNAGQTIELWPESYKTMRPARDKDAVEFITHYEAYRNGRWLRVDIDDVVPFRDGINPDNLMMGMNWIGSLYREIATDNLAANYSSTLLRNHGRTGIVISPSSPDAEFSSEESAKLKQRVIETTTGDRMGEPIVLSNAVKLDVPSFDPKSMLANEARDKPEERITGTFGVPAVLLGMQTDSMTYNNMSEADQNAYDKVLIPYHTAFAETVNFYLMPEFADPATDYVEHDYSKVRSLQDDQDRLYLRVSAGYDSGWLKRSEARTATGWDVSPEDEAYKDAGGFGGSFGEPTGDTEPAAKALLRLIERKDASNRVRGIERKIAKDMQALIAGAYEDMKVS